MHSFWLRTAVRRVAMLSSSLLLLGMSGCDSMMFGLDALDRATQERGVPDPDCKRQPTMIFPATVHTQGVLLINFVDDDRTRMHGRVLTWMALDALLPQIDRGTSEYGGYGLMAVAKALQRGFAYIEIERPPQSSNPQFPGSFKWMGGITGAAYTRFSLSKSGDPDCAQYQEEAANLLKYHQTPSLPSDECVAARAATKSESEYAIDIVELKDEPTGRSPYWESPTLWKIVDMGTKTTYAQMYRREAGSAFSCPALPERNRFYDLIQPAKADGASGIDTSS